MKRIWYLLCLPVLFMFLFVGCDTVPPHPEAGEWYCEELNMTFDMGNYTAKYVNDAGEYEEAEVNIDYGGHIYIERIGDDRSILETILRGDYRYRNGEFRIKDDITGQTYTFVEVTDPAG